MRDGIHSYALTSATSAWVPPGSGVNTAPPLHDLRRRCLDKKKSYESNCYARRVRRFFRRRMDPLGAYEYIQANCRSWPCLFCGPNIRLPFLQKRMVEWIPLKQLTCWATLTLPDDKGTPQQLAKHLTEAFSETINRYGHKPGPRLSYIWTKEFAQGRPHLHVFLPGTTKHKRFKELWHKYTGAEQVKFKDVDLGLASLHRVVSYDTKHIIRDAKEHGRACGRWYGTSQDIKINIDRPDHEGTGWEFVRDRIHIPSMKRQDLSLTADGRPTHFIVYDSDDERLRRSPAPPPRPAAESEGPEAAKPPLGPSEPAADPGGGGRPEPRGGSSDEYH